MNQQGALDAKSADNAFELVKDLCKKYEKTVILVTHRNELAKRSDRVIDLS
jgi:ABC-type lipoprotein export system ATPase subunit